MSPFLASASRRALGWAKQMPLTVVSGTSTCECGSPTTTQRGMDRSSSSRDIGMWSRGLRQDDT